MEKNKKSHIAVTSALKTIAEYKMVEAGDRIMISVSGGPDSVFLTHLFMVLAEDIDIKLYGFSLDHSTRGGQSGKDLEFVKKLYKELDIKLFSNKVDASSWCRKHGLSFQEGARKLRLEFLRNISEKHDINKVALGHNLDDNIETFLMRVIRGSGARGLSGISPVNGIFIRPLINTSRKDIEDFLKQNKTGFCLDRSNLEDKYVRNRIRNRLIPFIKDNFQGDLVSSIKRSLEILRDEDIFIAGYAGKILERSAEFNTDTESKKTIYIRMPADSIKAHPKALRRKMVQAALKKIMGNLEDISYRNVKDILAIAEAENGESKWLRPVDFLIVIRIGGMIHMVDTRFTGKMDPDIKEYIMDVSGKKERKEESEGQEIEISGTTDLPGFNMYVESRLTSDPGDYKNFPDSTAVMDFGKISTPIKVKSWQEGDRFFPLGMKGSKKLQDFFIDNKIPVNRRNMVPVFHDSEKIIWVGGMRIDKRVKVGTKTTDFLCLELFEK